MDMVNIKVGAGLLVAVMGYAVVFVGLILLMLVILALGKVMIAKAAKAKAAAPATKDPEPVPATPKAPGSAGELKLYDTDPKDAALIMAIVADTLGKPLNELRFKSIKEVKD